MAKVSVICLNYKTPDLIERFVKNVYTLHEDLELIFVNNSPDDGASEIAQKNIPIGKTSTILNFENPGISVAYNKAFEKTHGDYILLLGTDAYPTKETISTMLNFMDEKKDIGAATSALVLESGEVDLDAHRAFPTPLNSIFRFTGVYKLFPNSKFFNNYFLGHLAKLNTPHEIDAGISHFLLVRREAYEKISGFDEDFFVYGEDIDFCYRLKKAGYKIFYFPQFKTLHLKGPGVGTRKHNKKKIKRPFEYRKIQVERSVDAMIMFVKKHYMEKYPKPLLWLMFTGMFMLKRVRIAKEFIGF